MTDTDRLSRFADLVVNVGVNVQPGQDVVLLADLAHRDIARAIVERAYVAGAAFVHVEWSDGPVRHSMLKHASLERLTASRPWAVDRNTSWADQQVALINLAGDPDPHLFDDVDPAKAAAFPIEEAMAIQVAMLSTKMRWNIVAAPNPGWAKQIFGEPDVERLWAAVSTAMRLDEPDPVAAWRERSAELGARAKALDALELTEVHLRSAATDLTVGLCANTRWTGGGGEDPAGISFMPNIPTEEVFTSPDRRRADGHITLTKPVIVNGQQVEGMKVTFAGGRITDVTADSNVDAVLAQLEREGARSLGEVALVDRHSRIAKAGIVFHNTLFDENAGCHVAWGQSFPFTIEGGLEMSDDDRYEAGLNRAMVHTDVVVGGEGMTVTGTGPKGTVEILRDDEWVLPL
ncbi:MAG TPA: aminopeptidase [Micromonosporaceae bacterium]|jgi:aminopeptidase